MSDLRRRGDKSGLRPSLVRKVKKLKRACDTEARSRGCMNGTSLVTVGWFDLCDLIEYFEDTREAARRVCVARDALDKVFFTTSTDINGV